MFVCASFSIATTVNGPAFSCEPLPTGNTEWTEALLPAAKGADLLIAEAYFFEKKVKFHLDFHTLMAHLNELQPKRLIVTHMSEDMLARLEELSCECAEDGKLIEV